MRVSSLKGELLGSFIDRSRRSPFNTQRRNGQKTHIEKTNSTKYKRETKVKEN